MESGKKAIQEQDHLSAFYNSLVDELGSCTNNP